MARISWRDFSRNLGADPVPPRSDPNNVLDMSSQAQSDLNVIENMMYPGSPKKAPGGSSEAKSYKKNMASVYERTNPAMVGGGQPPAKAPEPIRGAGEKEYDRYTTRQLSQEEWDKLSGHQQNSVTANYLLYEASQKPARAEEIYDYLGVDKDKPPETYATLDDILAYGRGRLPTTKTDSSSFLQELTQKNRGMDSLPNNLALLLGRGTTPTEGYNLDNLETGFFQDMILSYLDGTIESPGAIDLFNEEFSAAVEGLPLDEVKSRFKTVAAAAKETNGSIDIDALANFYGLGD